MAQMSKEEILTILRSMNDRRGNPKYLGDGIRPAIRVSDLIAVLEQPEPVAVGMIAVDDVHGWHFSPTLGWEDIGKGTALFKKVEKTTDES
jgi:hypothetical protein